MSIKNLKQKLRQYKKIKKDLRVGSKERNKINKDIKLLKKELEHLASPNISKTKLIKKLKDIYSERRYPLVVDFRNYTEEELEKHLANIKYKRVF